MTNEEIRDALFKRCPVVANGIEYMCVNAVIYRMSEGKIEVSGELLDKCGHSVTVVPLKNIEKKGVGE